MIVCLHLCQYLLKTTYTTDDILCFFIDSSPYHISPTFYVVRCGNGLISLFMRKIMTTLVSIEVCSSTWEQIPVHLSQVYSPILAETFEIHMGGHGNDDGRVLVDSGNGYLSAKFFMWILFLGGLADDRVYARCEEKIPL